MPSYNLPTYLPLPHPSLPVPPRPPSPPFRVASVGGKTPSSCPTTGWIAPRPPASLRQSPTGQYLPPTHPRAYEWTRKSYRRSPLAFERPTHTPDPRPHHHHYVRTRSFDSKCPNDGVVSIRFLNRIDPRPLFLPEWYTDFEPECKEYRMYEHLARATAEKTLRNQMIKGDRFSEHESGASLGERELRLWAICLSVKKARKAMRMSASIADPFSHDRKVSKSLPRELTLNVRHRIPFPSTRGSQQLALPHELDHTSSEPSKLATSLISSKPRPHRRSGFIQPPLSSSAPPPPSINSSRNRTASVATTVSATSTSSALSNLGKRIRAFASMRRSSSDAIRSLTSSGHEMIKSLEALLDGATKEEDSDDETWDGSTVSSEGRNSSSSSLSTFSSDRSRSSSSSIESVESDSPTKWRKSSLYSLPNHTTIERNSSSPRMSLDEQVYLMNLERADAEKKVRRGSWGGRTRTWAGFFDSSLRN
ncbi:BZ3500_MvSof-1268-A1-R1_Chr7-1g09364 [Microbotryum saponariae]|uniref:BZ3500_MvSof-1268-A1-R1_Chr7-1g09364 protein n=1 Tax=Microbotryum saponariae TaxID=289078 RepID=A0A2X0LC59_9BASI|nr:BZ3501_MvSof-1269-A2-R1_Chr7-1g09069 [Microbotryum saponariae]SDA03299.1 BZ3500_MvSof-1268-A1-R1_Chr7-1g09364 [Microbotryum saponariae]